MGGIMNQMGKWVGIAILLGILVAILSLYAWNPVEMVTSVLGKIAGFFLQWDWFRELFGPR